MATKKQATKRKKATTIQDKHNKYPLNFTLIAIGLFLFLGKIFSTKVGTVGDGIINFFSGFFGVGLIVFAFFSVFLGVYNLYKKEGEGKGFYIGFSLLFFNILITLHLSFLQSFSLKTLVEAFKEQLGGGFIGAFFSNLIYTTIGSIGLYIFLVFIYIVSMILIVNNIKYLREFKDKSAQRISELADDLKLKNDLQKKEKDLVRGEKRKRRNRQMVEASQIRANMLSKEEFMSDSKKVDLKLELEEEPLPSFKPVDLEVILPVEKKPEKATKPQSTVVSNHEGAVKWKLPPIELLKKLPPKDDSERKKHIESTARLLEETLASFGVKIQVKEVSCGPSLTRYEAILAPGTKVSKIQNLSEDLALALAANSVRIEAPIPGKAAVGFEIPNKVVSPVSFREIIESPHFMNSRDPLTFALGKDITGKTITTSLALMPHLLIAGSTGSGKSVCLNTLICSLMYRYTPDQVKFLMIDPKKVELTPYNDIPHLVAPVVTDPKRSAVALKWMVSEMEIRYQSLSDLGVRDIKAYNEAVSPKERLPYIVVIIDELADLMMAAPVDVETSICRIAQKARAAGIHLIVATQRPSVQVITGDIKSNIPSRIAFAVFSQIDARTILDSGGAEKLLGNGDMLFTLKGGKLLRIQGSYISENEILKITTFLKDQGLPEYLKGCEVLEKDAEDDESEGEGVNKAQEDPLLRDAAKLVLESGQASISMLQRKLKIGYSRGARLIDLLEEKNFIGPFEGTKSREVLGNWEDFATLFGE